MSTPNSLAIEILKEMQKAIDDLEFVARVEKRVNDALDEIAVTTNYNMFRTRHTYKTVPGEARRLLPPGGRAINQLRYLDTGQPIWMWTTQEAARVASNLEQGGMPRIWIEDGNITSGTNILYQYRLAPVPDGEWEIEEEYFYHPSETASTQILPVQDQYLPLVRRFVRASLLRLDQKYDQAAIEQTAYDRLLVMLVTAEKRKIAMDTRLKSSDIWRDSRRGQAIFPPDRFQNPFL